MDFNKITRRLAEYDREAGLFIEQILAVSAVWDDIIDRDKPFEDAPVNSAFEIMLIHLPRNRFYSAHFNELNPILVMAIQNWYMANRIERAKQQEFFNISFIIRSSYVDLITMTAYIVGGSDLAQELGMAARVFAHDEGISGYIDALGKELSDREDE